MSPAASAVLSSSQPPCSSILIWLTGCPLVCRTGPGELVPPVLRQGLHEEEITKLVHTARPVINEALGTLLSVPAFNICSGGSVGLCSNPPNHQDYKRHPGQQNWNMTELLQAAWWAWQGWGWG